MSDYMNTSDRKKTARNIFRRARHLHRMDKSPGKVDFLAMRNRLYDAALDLDPEQFGSLQYKADFAYRDGKLSESLALYRRADEVLPNHPDVQYGIAACIFCLSPPGERAEEIRGYLDRALRSRPDFVSNDFVRKNASAEVVARADRRLAAKKNQIPLLLGIIAASAGLSAYSEQVKSVEDIPSLTKKS
jgi:tetratricopeptide (TPR) repeat protein